MTVDSWKRLVTGCALVLSCAALAQEFPSKPITIVVPFAPGGVTDPVARIVGQKISESVRLPVLIDNRPGAAGIIGAQVVQRSAPDGYTLFFGNATTHAVNQALYPKLPYDPIADFQPITVVIVTKLILVVPLNSPANSVADLIALSKTRRGGLSYASQGSGSGGQLAAEMFRRLTGAVLTHVPYKGSAPALQDMLAGRVDLFFDAMVTSYPQVREGKLKALAIAAASRSPLLPELRTLTELGHPGIDFDVWFGIFARAGTPAPIVRKLHAEIVKAVNAPDVRSRFSEQGFEMASNTPEEFAALIERDAERFGRIVRDAGIKVE